MTRSIPRASPAGVSRNPLPEVVGQHVDEAAFLRELRSRQVRSPGVDLPALERLDARIDAHLDGILVAGDDGAERCLRAIESPSAGTVFACAVTAIARRDDSVLDLLLGLAAAGSSAHRGLVSAFGWVPASRLRGIVRGLLASADDQRRAVGIAACDLQGVDVGAVATDALRGTVAGAATRLAAVRWLVRAGHADAVALIEATQPTQAALASALLGDRGAAVSRLEDDVLAGRASDLELAVCLLAMPFERARGLMRALARNSDATSLRRLVTATGWLGDGRALPWLVEMAGDPRWARVAGEAVSTITGLDLVRQPFESAAPDDTTALEDGPLEIDPDEGLPWPAADRLDEWLRGPGARYVDAQLLLGKPPTVEHCGRVLHHGTQRQRRLAALRLKLSAPRARWFDVAAPGRRQRLALDLLEQGGGP